MLGIWYSRHLLGSGTRVATPGSPGRQGSARRVERSEPLPFREFWRRALPERPKEMTLKRCSPTSEGEQGPGAESSPWCPGAMSHVVKMCPSGIAAPGIVERQPGGLDLFWLGL